MARKLSRKARAAALRNLAKARRARKRKSKSHESPKRKRRVSKAQRAAARRNIKKAQSGKRRKKACRKAAGRRGAAKRAGRAMPAMPKKCKPRRRKGKRRVKAVRHSGGKRKSAKRVAAGKKAARTRKRHKAERAKSARKGKRRSRKTSHRRKSGKRKSAKRVRAGKKAARTRRHHKVVDHQATPGSDSYYMMESRRKRKRRESRRRRNPVLANPLPNPRRRHRRRNPLNPFFRNPINGPGEFLAGLFGVGMGYVAADLADRLLATHPLVSTSAGYVDSPPAGNVYDSEAPLTPIWSSPFRFVGALGMIFVPGILSQIVPGNLGKSFFQLAGYGAAARVAGKLISDGIAAAMPTTGLTLQAYGPEIAAQNRLAQVAGTAPTTQNAGMFAGPPKTRQLGAPVGIGGCGTCGGNCGGGCSNLPISSDPVADAQGAQQSGQPTFVATTLNDGNLDWQHDPNVSSGDDCAPGPIPVNPYQVPNTLPSVPPPIQPPTQLPIQSQQLVGGGGPQPCPPGTYLNDAGQCVSNAPPGAPDCPPGQTWAPGIGCVTPGPDARLYPGGNLGMNQGNTLTYKDNTVVRVPVVAAGVLQTATPRIIA